MRTVLVALYSAAFTVSGRDSLAKLNRATRKQSNDQQNGSVQRATRRKCDGECYTYWNIKSHGAVRVQPSITCRPLSIPVSKHLVFLKHAACFVYTTTTTTTYNSAVAGIVYILYMKIISGAIISFRPEEFIFCQDPVDHGGNVSAFQELGYGCVKASTFLLERCGYWIAPRVQWHVKRLLIYIYKLITAKNVQFTFSCSLAVKCTKMWIILRCYARHWMA